MGKYVATHAPQYEIDKHTMAENIEGMVLDAGVMFPMAPPAYARGLWKHTQAGHAICEHLMVARDDTNLHLYIEQPGRFNSADKGEVDEMGMVTFEQALLGTCSTVYQEMRVVVNSPLTVTIGQAPATNDAHLSTFINCIEYGTTTLAQNGIDCPMCAVDPSNSRYLSIVDPRNPNALCASLMSKSRMGNAAEVEETTRTIYSIAHGKMLTSFAPSHVHLLCVGAGNREDREFWFGVTFLRDLFIADGIDVTISFCDYPSRFVGPEVGQHMVTAVVYSQAPQLVEEAELAAAEAASFAYRARGSATMAGPHAEAIHSAGGRASNITHSSQEDQVEFHSSGGVASGKKRRAGASWFGKPIASLSQAEAKNMAYACTKELLRKYEADGAHGAKPKPADGREAIARGWRG